MNNETTPDITNPYNFKPGIFEHYKGGTYTALMLVRHHETRELLVVYISHKFGTFSVREWATPGKDSWTDLVQVPTTRGGELTYDEVPRFRLVSPMPFDVGAQLVR